MLLDDLFALEHAKLLKVGELQQVTCQLTYSFGTDLI